MNEAPVPGPDLTSYLRSGPLFAGLSDPMLSALARGFRIRTLRKGQILFSQFDPAKSAYSVRSGSVSIVLASAGGRELLIDEMSLR